MKVGDRRRGKGAKGGDSWAGSHQGASVTTRRVWQGWGSSGAAKGVGRWRRDHRVDKGTVR